MGTVIHRSPVLSFAVMTVLLLAAAPGARAQTQGAMTISPPAVARPGGMVSFPVVLTLDSGVSVDKVGFIAEVMVGASPTISGMSFVSALSGTSPTVTNSYPTTLAVQFDVLSPALSGTITLGTASFTIPTTATPGQSYWVHLTSATLYSGSTQIWVSTGDYHQVQVSNPAASITKVSGGGQQGTVGTALPAPLVVLVSDASGNPVIGATVTFAIMTFAITAGGGALTPADGQVTTGSDGKAQVTLTLGTTAVTHEVTASTPGESGATISLPEPFLEYAVPGPPVAMVKMRGDAQIAPPGTKLSDPLVVKVADQYGNGVGGVAVTFAVTGGGGSLNPADGKVQTASNGLASIDWTLGPSNGTNTVSASTGLPGGTASVTFSAFARTPAAIAKVSGDKQSFYMSGIGVPWSPFVVLVTDASNNPVPGATVTFAVTAGGLALNPANGQVATGSDGKARVWPDWTHAFSVTNTVTASTPGASGSTISLPQPFSVTGIVPDDAEITAGPGATGTVATQLPQSLYVYVFTKDGNAIQGAAVDFTVDPAGSASGTSVSFNPARAVTDTYGKAQTIGTLGQKAGIISVTASVAGVAQTAVIQVFARADVPVSFLKVSGDAQAALPGAPLELPLTVRAADKYDNGVDGLAVTWVVMAGGGSLAWDKTSTYGSNYGPGGKAVNYWTLGSSPGTQTLSGAVETPGGTLTATFSASAGTPSLAISVSPGSVSLDLGGSSQTVTVTLTRTNYSGSLTLSWFCANTLSGVGVTISQPDRGSSGSITFQALSVAAQVSGVEFDVRAFGTGVTPVTAKLYVTVGPSSIGITSSFSSMTLVAGGSWRVTSVTVARANFSGSVTLALGTLPTGVTATITQPGTGDIGSIKLQAASSAALVSNQAITVTASGTGVPSASATFNLTVSAPSKISLSVSPSALSLVAGSGSQTVTLTLTGTNAPWDVTEALGTLPSGVTATIYQAGGADHPGSIILQAASNAAAVTNQAITITASGPDVISATATLSLTVSTAAGGTVTAGSARGAPGGEARIPVILALNSGVSVDALSFGLQVTADGAAPALTGALSFVADAAIPNAPSLVDTAAAPNIVSIAWLGNLNPALSGTVQLGEVVVTIPAAATDGQGYAVQITAASGGSGATAVALGAGADATLTVAVHTYLIGDVFPVQPDGGNNAGGFGDETLAVLDLIAGLRAVTNVPGFRPPSCSDRYDAMDAFPADTSSARGGDGTLDVLDLIITLRRVTDVDTSRPRRSTRGLSCPTAEAQVLASAAREQEHRASLPVDAPAPAGALEFGAAEAGANGALRVPVYLRARNGLLLAGLSFALGLQGNHQDRSRGSLRFLAAEGRAPSLLDQELPDALAMAWLDGFWVPAGERFLLGFVEIAGPDAAEAATSLVVYGAAANARHDGRPVPLAFPSPERIRAAPKLQ